MSDENKPGQWTPQYDEKTLRGLVEEAVRAIGVQDPMLSPSKIRERLVGRVTGDIDLDALIKDVLADLKKEK